MSLAILFHFLYTQNVWALIYPSSGACDLSIVSPHWSCVLVSMRVGVSVWLGWCGIRVAVCFILLHGDGLDVSNTCALARTNFTFSIPCIIVQLPTCKPTNAHILSELHYNISSEMLHVPALTDPTPGCEQ